MKMLKTEELTLISGGCNDCKKIVIDNPPATPTPILADNRPVFEFMPSPGLPDITYIS